MFEKLSTAAKHIQSKCRIMPKVGIVLGSGLDALITSIEDQTIIQYSDIPFFKPTSNNDHEGKLILGKINNVEVAVLQGRLHAYEGSPMDDIVFPVRVLATLGAESLILTNAAGGVNEDFNPGDLVVIEDHINLMACNPLIGPNINKLGPQFPDMTTAYDPEIINSIKESGKELNINLKNGVYTGVLGPTYETPAEVRMIKILGGDMVGMSTVPESIAANHLGLKVAGISCITNMAAGLKKIELENDQIKRQAKEVMKKFVALISKTIEKMGQV